MRTTLFAGCAPEVAVAPDGRILAVGRGAREAAGQKAIVHGFTGRAVPGLGDAHLHLEWLARGRRGVDLAGTRSLAQAQRRIGAFAAKHPRDTWLVGRGWWNDAWRDHPGFPGRADLDAVTGARPAVMTRKDGHSVWGNSAALAAMGITRTSPDPPGGVIDRDAHGDPTGILRESACAIANAAVPAATDADFDADLLAVLRDLRRSGLTTVHTMDGPRLFAGLQRLHAQRRLPIRVVWNLPVANLGEAAGLGLRSGFGDGWLRVWGVKAFLDGSLGTRTAEMFDGRGVVVTPQEELVDIVRRTEEAGLNVCLHAIGDKAVSRALDALATVRRPRHKWRPRIEHAQCVRPNDIKRFARHGVIASMQPLHAVSDRAMADQEWRGLTRRAYAWGALERAGAVLAFGSDAPVEDWSPLAGLDAASGWRHRAAWHPELALSRSAALRAYTSGVAFAAGMERETGRLRRGMRCDVTIVDGDRVVATGVDGQLS